MAEISKITLPSGDQYDIKDTVARASIPTNVSDLTNDSGYVAGPASATDNRIAVFDGTTGKLIRNSGFTIATSVPANAVFTDTKDTSQFSRPNYQAGISDITIQPLINDLRANHLAFLPASQIIIEKTTDGGQTWVDAGVSDETKTGLFAETRPGVSLPQIDGKKNILCGIRVTFTAMKYNVPEGTPETQKYSYWNSSNVISPERYNNLRELYFWVSSGPDKIKVKVERASGANPNTWLTSFDDQNALLQGWSGNDYIKLNTTSVFGGSISQTSNFWNYRITFMSAYNANASSFSESYITGSQSISEIRGYGTNWWTAGNKYASSDHLYSWDYQKNATFPAKITATDFVGKVNGYTIAKSVPSNAVFTDTIYESLDPVQNGGTVSLVTTGEKYTWNNKYTKPSGGIPASDLAANVIPSVPVTDVQINSASILSSGTANIPIASASSLGVVKVDAAGTWGVGITNAGLIYVKVADSQEIKNPDNVVSAQYTPISIFRQHEAVFYGLAKAAGDTSQSSSSNSVGTYTASAKTAIRTMLGAGTYSKPSGGIPASDLAPDAIGSADITVIADEYDPSANYSANGYCTNDGKLYKANTNVNAETWNSSHWDETTVMDEIIARCSIIPAAGVSF